MNSIPGIKVEFIKDDSGMSEKRSREAVEIIFQMMLLTRKRGRPSKRQDEEDLNAA